jgi:hypothetical protein
MRLHGHHSDHSDARGKFDVFLTVCVLSVLAIAGVVNVSRMVALAAPKVGDIVSFVPGTASAPEVDARLTVARSGGGTCILDIGFLQRAGGSLIVEHRTAIGAKHLYRTHWSGPSTSGDAGDCGSAADLTLSDGDMGALAMAAGGYGPTHTVKPGRN